MPLFQSDRETKLKAERVSKSVNRWSVESMFRLSPGAAALALLSVLNCTQTLLSAGSKLQAAKP